MNNADKPRPEDLPSPARLLRAAIAATIGAVVILTAVVLPAEYAIDPTGAGRILGLTEMGEIKRDLAAEAQRDLKLHDNHQSSILDAVLGLFIESAHAQEMWQDEVVFTLVPGASAEVKLKMVAGAVARYTWVASGGRINFDLHAHGDGQSINYERGRGAASGEGSIQAPFAGDHGWFWRNRDDSDVTVTLQLGGEYSKIVESD